MHGDACVESALGIADEVVETIADGRRGADLVILCVPVGACGEVAQEIAPASEAGRDRLRCRLGQGLGRRATWQPHLPEGVHFIPAHPVAGTENSGPDAGFAELFVNRWCILTPAEGADPRRRRASCRRSGRRSAPMSRS